MALEIERKFLVDSDNLPTLHNGILLIQGYLSLNPQVRFRIQEEKVILTVKSHLEGISRFEFEATNLNPPIQDLEALKKLAILPLIEKRRYKIPFEGFTWEIDIYEGANSGLITAEVELPSTDAQPPFPNWIKKTNEVSSDFRYFNTNLAQKPFSLWE